MKELTYLLGAGSSFQSIPVVKTFASRFSEFLSYLNDVQKDNGMGQTKQVKFKMLYDIGLILQNEFANHQSFDTYFKKLYHTGRINEIRNGKKILNLYFIWEHLTGITQKSPVYDETKFWKQSRIDKRYDALIAGLLQPLQDKLEPFCKINFITWNYDLNLLISLKNYFLPHGTIGEFLENIDKKNGTWQIDNKITVVNMNGYFYCSNFNSLVDLNNVVIHHIVDEKTNPDYFDNSYVDSDSELIKFAWESDGLITNIAKEKINNSENLVIIGYTFPLYNRLVDLKYLDQPIVRKKKIFVQDPNSNIIRQNIVDYYQLGSEEYFTNLVSISNCDSFYIPSIIFGIKDKTGEYYFV